MTANFSVALRSARANQIVLVINAGTGPGAMLFYTAPKPAAGAAVTTQTLLATAPFAEPAGTVVNGVLTFNPLTEDALTPAEGDADWARIVDGNGAFVADLSVTNNAGIGPVKMASTHIYQNGVLLVTSMVIIEGNM
jgi:hypothetical protein